MTVLWVFTTSCKRTGIAEQERDWWMCRKWESNCEVNGSVTPWMTGQRGSRHRAGGYEGGVVGVVRDRGRSSPGLDYSVRWVSGHDEGGFGKGFGLSLCAVPLTQLVPHLGWWFD
jgi:hypothetical protein